MHRFQNEGTAFTIPISLVVMEEKEKKMEVKKEENREQKTDEGMMVIHRWTIRKGK
jgi:hypothetical protein